MDFNLFSWIRDGVRRSVMLGVADAMESVGTPPTSQDLQKSLQDFRSRIEMPMDRNALTPSLAGSSAAPQRKRLGRTLKDIKS
jgi:hypothetical protein